MTNATKVVHQQETIFTLLKMYGNEKGYVKGLTVASISKLTGVTAHDVAKTLWGLQKQGLLGFSEKKHGKQTEPYRFRITQKGLNAGEEQVRQAEPIESPEIVIDLNSEGEVEMSVDISDVDVGSDKAIQVPQRRITPRAKDYLKDLALRETDLRLCADLLEDYGYTELAVAVLEKVKLSNDEWRQLKEFMEV